MKSPTRPYGDAYSCDVLDVYRRLRLVTNLHVCLRPGCFVAEEAPYRT